MQRIVRLAIVCSVLVGGAVAVQGQQPLEEVVEVDLAIVDVLVLDRQGVAVGGLTRDDFLLTVQGRAREIDTFDVVCPEGGLADPEEIGRDDRREAIVSKSDRRLVLAFDYYSLSHPNRTAATRWGQIIAARDMVPGDGIMVVSLADGLRVEQRFSGSPEKVFHTLQRMEHDVSLYGRTFEPTTQQPFFADLNVLSDVLAQYPGPKSVVLFSEWRGRSDDWDTFFLEAAEHASAARAAFYPVWVPGLQGGEPSGGAPGLRRLATESGGRYTRMTDDLSLAYVRGRRDLACRYAIGYYVDPEVSGKGHTVRVRVKGGGLEVRAPERTRRWTEKQRQTSRLRAAFADPGPNEHPLVRAFAYPFRPRSGKSWEALVAVNFPLHVEADGAVRIVGASLEREHLSIVRDHKEVSFTAPKDGKPGVRPVTMYAVRKVKPGEHKLTVAVGKPGSDSLKTTRVEFSVPQVPKNELIVRGPIMVKVDPEGIRMRVEGGKPVDDARLDELIGDAGFVPLLVSQVTPADEVIAAWEICAVGTSGPSGATVERRIRAEGEVVHRLDPLPLALQGNKKLACQSGVDKLPGGTLDEGRYRFEVAVVKGNDDKALGLRQFAVKELPPED
jgi:VWFA-related protein